MSLIDRLNGTEEPGISAHKFFGALVRLADGQTTRAQIETQFAIETTGTDASEFDALVAGYQSAASRARYLGTLHAIFMLAEDLGAAPLTKGQINTWLTAATEPFGTTSYAGIYVDVSQPEQPVTAGTWEKIEAQLNAVAMPAVNATSDAAAGRVTLGMAGDYELSYQCSFQGTNNTDFRFALYGNNTIVPSSLTERSVTGSSDSGSVGCTVIANAPSNGINVDLRVENLETSQRNITVQALQLTAKRLS